MLRRLTQKNNQLLILNSRGFGINGAIAEFYNEKITIKYQCKNAITDIEQALSDICSQLSSAGYPLPKKAILISGATTNAVLNLPIEENKKLPAQQMLELVRWEMEPLFSDHIGQLAIGGLLIALQFINESQRQQLLTQLTQQKEQLAGRGGRAPARFGELAISNGFISQQQLDQCLTIHENIQLRDPAIDCSWQQLGNNHDAGGSQWLCSAINQVERRQWLNACAANKIFLSAIYSQHQSSVNQLPVVQEQSGQLLLIVNQSLVTLIHIIKQQAVAIKHYQCSETALDTGSLLTLLTDTTLTTTELAQTAIYYTGDHPQLSTLISELSTAHNSELIKLDQQAPADAAIFGAAKEYFKATTGTNLSKLSGTPPPPPRYKQPEWQAGLFCSVIALAIGANEACYYYKQQQVFDEIQQNALAVEKIEVINNKLNSANDKYNQLKKQKVQLEQQLQVLSERKQGLNTVLLKRQDYIKNLLPLISRSSNELLILEKIAEDGWYHFAITGWAADQLAIDKFNQQLTSELEIWLMQILI